MSDSPDQIGFFAKILRWLKIDPRIYLALLHAYALMDFRNQKFGRVTASKPKERLSPLFWIVGQNLLIGLFLSGLMFARVDAFFFALVALGTSMVAMATSIIVEFNEVVIDPDDLHVIGHQPVPIRTYTAARVTNLFGYVLLVTVTANVFPAIVGLGLRDTSWLFFPTYVVAVSLGNMAVTGGIILLYTFLWSGKSGGAVQEVLAWTQTLLMGLFFYGAQAVFRDKSDTLAMVAYQLPGWVMYLPPAWLAHFVRESVDGITAIPWWIAGAVVIATVAVWVLVIGRLGDAYGKMQPSGARAGAATMKPLARPGELLGVPWRWIATSQEQRTGFWLCWTMLARDHNLRMRSWPALGIVIAVLLLGWVGGQLHNPLESPGPESVVSVVCIYLFAIPIPTVIHNLNFSKDWSATWVLESAPIEDRFGFAEGLRKAVTWHYLLPLLAMLGLVFALVWQNPLHAGLHLLIAWLVVEATGYACQVCVLRKHPFSSPLARGESMGPIAPFIGAVSTIAVVLATVHYFLVQLSPWLLSVQVALMMGIVLGLRIWSAAMCRRTLAVRQA